MPNNDASLRQALARLQVVVDAELDPVKRMQGDDKMDQIVGQEKEALSREPKLRSTIDAAIALWVEENRIPAVVREDKVMRLLIWNRFSFACLFAKGLDEFGFCNPLKTDKELLRWLLIECWPGCGVSMLKATFYDLATMPTL